MVMDKREFAKLSIKLKRELTAPMLDGLKLWMKAEFGAGELDAMSDFGDIWNALERTGLIGTDDVDYLRDYFEESKAMKLVEILDKAVGTPDRSKEKAVKKAKKVSDDGGVPVTRYTTPQQPVEERSMLKKSDFFKDSVYDFRDAKGKMKNRGIMLIINQFKEQRKGTLNDVHALRDLFEKQLDFHVDLRHDQTKEMVIRALHDKVSMMKDNSVERFFCVILSHGDKKGIWCTGPHGVKEQQINIEEEVLPMFRANNLKGMIDRPKVFIVQACRGKEYQYGVRVSEDAMEEDAKPMASASKEAAAKPETTTDLGPLIIPNEADFLVAYPQMEGYKSFRNMDEGSWFIQTLVRVFTECYEKEDLVSMLTEVNYQVSKMCHQQWFQMPCFMSSLRKKIYLGKVPQQK